MTARNKMMQELAIETNMVKSELTKEQASNRAKIWTVISKGISYIFCFLLLRAQAWPYAKPYFYKYKARNAKMF